MKSSFTSKASVTNLNTDNKLLSIRKVCAFFCHHGGGLCKSFVIVLSFHERGGGKGVILCVLVLQLFETKALGKDGVFTGNKLLCLNFLRNVLSFFFTMRKTEVIAFILGYFQKEFIIEKRTKKFLGF